MRGSPATIGPMRAPARDRRRLARAPRLPRDACGRGRRRAAGRAARSASPTCCSRRVRATQPRAVIVCMDTRMPSYRHEILPAYQGQRDPFADDLCEQLDRLPELAEAFGYAAAKLEPWEADDLLATSVALEEARGGGALVLSSDRDTYQLVSDVTVDAAPAAARRARARRPRGRDRALRDRARAGDVADRAARRPVRQHPGRTRHRPEDGRRAAAPLRRSRGRDRARGRADAAPARGRRRAAPTTCAATSRSRRCAAICRSRSRTMPSSTRSRPRPGARRPACSGWPRASRADGRASASHARA